MCGATWVRAVAGRMAHMCPRQRAGCMSPPRVFWFQSGKLVTKMFQKIQELIDDKDALVFVLIDEVGTHRPRHCREIGTAWPVPAAGQPTPAHPASAQHSVTEPCPQHPTR